MCVFYSRELSRVIKILAESFTGYSLHHFESNFVPAATLPSLLGRFLQGCLLHPQLNVRPPFDFCVGVRIKGMRMRV
jgi:hypothetical protein